jgi:hypothetical protein
LEICHDEYALEQIMIRSVLKSETKVKSQNSYSKRDQSKRKQDLEEAINQAQKKV